MKKRSYDLIIAAILIFIGIGSALIFKFSFNKSLEKIAFPQLKVSEFKNLVDSQEQKIWFYIDTSQSEKVIGLSEDTPIKKVIISRFGNASMYIPTGGTVTFKDYEGLSPLAMIQRTEGNVIPNITFKKVDSTFIFKTEDTESANEIRIILEQNEGFGFRNNLDLTILTDYLLQNIPCSNIHYAGYFYQSQNADRFLMFRTEALVTPQTE